MRAWPGQPHPLGATWDGRGVNVAVFAGDASAMEVCLFDRPEDGEPRHRVAVREQTGGVWHCYLPDIRPGQLYGLRVHGPYQPRAGRRFNASKLLVDPHARALAGSLSPHPSTFGTRGSDPHGPRDEQDSAASVPKCVVVDPAFDWAGDRPPATPWSRTLIYEAHVRGLTIRHPGVDPALRGTYLGLCAPPVVEHLLRLGVTAVELMPVQHFATEPHLTDLGLTNYWGYNPIAFMAPHAPYATACRGEQVVEFKRMVRTLHERGLEVLLDVVFGHTGEGGHGGPTLGLKGLGNATYYRLRPEDHARYEDFTGCGNTLRIAHPRTLQLVMDALRYWVRDMHVDGFRFDQAVVLGRDGAVFDPWARLFTLMAQDPVLAGVKLIAEPWDLGPGGYQLGGFAWGWAEWNGRYRTGVRSFWRGDAATLAEMASRLAGSSDLFAGSGRGPSSSVNHVACHDGFTLHDLVSHERKHNEANGEGNRDGFDDNRSCNWGVEGETDEPRVRRRRERMKRNFLATLACSQGVPMLLMGDEMGRTQRGNNNAYCQDSEVSWVDWTLTEEQRDLLAFARRVLTLRQDHPVLRRRTFFRGHPVTPGGEKDLAWLRADGTEMTPADWHDPELRHVGCLIQGSASDYVDEEGNEVTGATLLLLLNAGPRRVRFALPAATEADAWQELVHVARRRTRRITGRRVAVPPRCLILLERTTAP
jgi:glycogen operon protein